MIKALIFDCYGTIISTGDGSVNLTKIILDNLKVNIDPVLFYKNWKKIHRENIYSLKYFCKEKEIFINDLNILFKIYNINGNIKKNIKPMLKSLYKRYFFDDVIKNLKLLKKDYKIYIASNSDTKPLMKNIGKEKYLFNGIYTSEKIRAYKPSRIFFEKILNKIKINKDEILFIGDSIEDDIIGANNVGLKTVLIDRKNNSKYIGNEASYIIKDMNELLNIIELNNIKKVNRRLTG
jgi:2-haloalkanoic acid dehalogenase type II